ncbi:type II methionyl aminopeptidase [Waddlia chondrophila]|uniref:type II methionyl aminopeptidase n=1 Tax=Waddlia chondrophila TaxID=71667 RepID=UPI0009ABEF82|nr:type II methionyl aminopeptidase [Waddlia chondrophila]
MKDNNFQHFIEAGKRAKEVRAYGKSLIVKGASYKDVTAKIRQKIKELDAIPAFPPQIALNETAAHFLPSPDEEIIFKDELIKLDIGVCYKGAIGDCAVTIDLGGKHQKLINAVEAALLAAEKIIEVGLPIQEIGRVIEETIHSFGLKPIENLTGHGLGNYCVHKAPMIPNCFHPMREKIEPGMTFAIEPFATDGFGAVYEKGRPEIFSLTQHRYPLNPQAKAFIRQIKEMQGLPFELADLRGEGKEKVVNYLLRKRILTGYPPLVEEGNGMVAQAENSVLVDLDGSVTITTR